MWYRGIPDELRWWREWLPTDEGRAWQADVLDPARPIQDHVVAELLGSNPDDELSVLEIGSGPITHLGYTLPGKRIHLTAVDPLAREYSAMLREANVVAPVALQNGEGETLLERFQPGRFDLAWASNAVDHCYDPVLVIRNLLALVKIGHPVVLRHYRNEGSVDAYDGLHQWNVDERSRDLVVWSVVEEQNVTRLLEGEAKVECFIEPPRAFGAFEHSEWVVAVLTRLR